MGFVFFGRAALLATGLSLAAGAAFAQRLQPSQLQPDAALLREALVMLHPSLYRHLDSVDVDRRFAALAAGPFSRSLTIAEAYRALNRAVVGLRDSRTYPNPLNQPKSVRAVLFGGATALPFWFRLTPEKQLVVVQVLPAAQALPVGAEVVKLDGRPVTEVLDTLLTATRGDGSNDANRLRRLWVEGSGPAAPFDVLYPLYFPIGERVKVEYRTAADDLGVLRVAVVPVVRAADRDTIFRATEPPANNTLGWRLEFPDARTARLTLPDCGVTAAAGFDWRRWLSESFYTIRQKKCSALVLDIRACAGGADEVVTTLLPYLLKKTVRLSPERQLWRTNQLPVNLASMLDTGDPELKRIFTPTSFQRTADGFFERKDRPAVAPVLRPDALAFQGLYFYALCGPRNSGASFRLLRLIKEHDLGVLIGQPTGGNRRGITGGATFRLRLPNSGLEIDLPMVSYQPLRAQPDEGLEPDELVTPTLTDLRRNTDLEMARVTQLLREARQE